MKWIEVDKEHELYPQGYRLCSMFNILDMDKYYCMVAKIEANGMYIATLNYSVLGEYKTIKLAKKAAERALVKRFFRHKWDFEHDCDSGYLDVDLSNLYKDRLYLKSYPCKKMQMAGKLSQAKKDFIREI